MSPEPIAAALGGSLVTAAAVRTAITRVSIRRRLSAALEDPVPGTRVAAIQTIGENGVGRNARMLLAAATAEKDVWVRQVLAQTVVRHRWEPANTKALVELRIWAKQELLWSCLEPAPDDRAAALDTAAGVADTEEGADTADTRVDVDSEAEAHAHAHADPEAANSGETVTAAFQGRGWWDH